MRSSTAFWRRLFLRRLECCWLCFARDTPPSIPCPLIPHPYRPSTCLHLVTSPFHHLAYLDAHLDKRGIFSSYVFPCGFDISFFLVCVVVSFYLLFCLKVFGVLVFVVFVLRPLVVFILVFLCFFFFVFGLSIMETFWRFEISILVHGLSLVYLFPYSSSAFYLVACVFCFSLFLVCMCSLAQFRLFRVLSLFSCLSFRFRSISGKVRGVCEAFPKYRIKPYLMPVNALPGSKNTPGKSPMK